MELQHLAEASTSYLEAIPIRDHGAGNKPKDDHVPPEQPSHLVVQLHRKLSLIKASHTISYLFFSFTG
jgi:hypothetical protein